MIKQLPYLRLSMSKPFRTQTKLAGLYRNLLQQNRLNRTTRSGQQGQAGYIPISAGDFHCKQPPFTVSDQERRNALHFLPRAKNCKRCTGPCQQRFKSWFLCNLERLLISKGSDTRRRESIRHHVISEADEASAAILVVPTRPAKKQCCGSYWHRFPRQRQHAVNFAFPCGELQCDFTPLRSSTPRGALRRGWEQTLAPARPGNTTSPNADTVVWEHHLEEPPLPVEVHRLSKTTHNSVVSAVERIRDNLQRLGGEKGHIEWTTPWKVQAECHGQEGERVGWQQNPHPRCAAGPGRYLRKCQGIAIAIGEDEPDGTRRRFDLVLKRSKPRVSNEAGLCTSRFGIPRRGPGGRELSECKPVLVTRVDTLLVSRPRSKDEPTLHTRLEGGVPPWVQHLIKRYHQDRCMRTWDTPTRTGSSS